jgi:hypothetical protein
LTYVSLSFFGLFGIVWILLNLHFKKYSHSIAAAVVFLFIVTEFTFNYKDNDLKDVHCFEDYSKSVLNSVKPNSIIFSYFWDGLVSPSCYFQLVEHYRQDVVVIDKELLRRSWYYNQISTQHPEVLKDMQGDIARFLDALKPFERNESFDANLLEVTYRKIMTDLIVNNTDKREFYISPELVDNEMQKGEFVLPAGYTLVQDNLLFRVVKGKDYVPATNPDFTIRIPQKKTRYTEQIVNAAGSMLARRAFYELQFYKTDRARLYINKIKKDFPDYNLPTGLSDAMIK